MAATVVVRVTACCSWCPLPAFTTSILRSFCSKSFQSPPPPPPPSSNSPPSPTPPNALRKPVTFTLHGKIWEDPYSWMSDFDDTVSMRHMRFYIDSEQKYAEEVMATSERLQRKLISEIASRIPAQLSSPPIQFGPWLYYRRVEEGKQYPVLCRRSASLHKELYSYKSPSAGFDFVSGRKIEQKIFDYNQEALRFGGHAYENVSDISPDHQYYAYTMYDKNNDCFNLSVRELNSGNLLQNPQVINVSNLAWAMGGKALLYVVIDQNERPYRVFCCMIGSNDHDILIFEEKDENARIKIRHTKDFKFVTVNTYSSTCSKIYVINASDPLSGLKLVWECGEWAQCVVEHHMGFLFLFTDATKNGEHADFHYLLRCPIELPYKLGQWETVFIEDPGMNIVDIDFNEKHMVLIVRDGRKLRICSINLPFKNNKAAALKELNPLFLPLPMHVSKILPGPNYDYYSSVMRFTISSSLMPDAVVDYDIPNGMWKIIEQQNLLEEKSQFLYGPSADHLGPNGDDSEHKSSWNDLSEYYGCEHYDVPSFDGVKVPLTIVYSHSKKNNRLQIPGLLHGHGAYGSILGKGWCSEFKSLLDRGWIVAYADVRGSGGLGKRWRKEGIGRLKLNGIKDYVWCARFLVETGIVQSGKLAGWGDDAGGLLVAAAINYCPQLFRAAILKAPFIDATYSLHHLASEFKPLDYEEFGNPEDEDDFYAIRGYSPYDNVKKDVLYPAMFITSSLNSRFGLWEAAKWVARVREYTIHDPRHPILLKLSVNIVEENRRYIHCKESALEMAFLMKAMDPSLQ